MGLYQYKALSNRGKKFKATIDADSLHDAKLKLIRLKVTALQIEPLKEGQIKDRLTSVAVLNLTREMARLLQAGLPLFETLSALEEKYRGSHPHRLLLNLTDLVKSGYSFSQSLKKHPETFDILYVSMVANSEKTGRLSEALTELSELIWRQQQTKKQLIGALLYPSLLSGFCLIVLGSLLFYVIPSLKELFDGRDLHPFTMIVFTLSEWACNSKLGLTLFSLGAIGLGAAMMFSQRVKRKITPYIYKIPFLKTLLAKVAFVRFCRAASTLLEGGLPLVDAFAQARRVMRHPILEKVIERGEQRISQGEAIHAPFVNHPLIEPLVPRMIAIAEEGGKLPFMMRQIAQIYEEELEKSLTLFATVAQPVLLLVLGIVIGFVLLSVLLPLTDVSSFAAN